MRFLIGYGLGLIISLLTPKGYEWITLVWGLIFLFMGLANE